jgi:hypothetical protein
MIAIAVSQAPVGIDLEPLGSISASDIDGLCPAWPDLDPTSKWTAFEAFGKLFSVGTALPMQKIETHSIAKDGLTVSIAGRTVRIALFPCKEHQIAVAEFET